VIDDRWSPLLARSVEIPIFETMSLQIAALSEGRATLTMPYDRRYDGIFQSFHGGLLMTLADTAACIAILTLAGADAVITTTDMNIRFLAACTSNVTAEARVIKFGRSLCPTEVMLRDGNQREIAIAQVTYMRLERMPKR
jgi:uncharacterized protein (TIGR00369 family)